MRREKKKKKSDTIRKVISFFFYNLLAPCLLTPVSPSAALEYSAKDDIVLILSDYNNFYFRKLIRVNNGLRRW